MFCNDGENEFFRENTAVGFCRDEVLWIKLRFYIYLGGKSNDFLWGDGENDSFGSIYCRNAVCIKCYKIMLLHLLWKNQMMFYQDRNAIDVSSLL